MSKFRAIKENGEEASEKRKERDSNVRNRIPNVHIRTDTKMCDANLHPLFQMEHL